MENGYHCSQEQWGQHPPRSGEAPPNHPSRERSYVPYNPQYNSEMENNIHYSQGQWDIHHCGSGKVLPNHASGAWPSVCYNIQYNGAVDPPIQTYCSQPLTSYIHQASPEIAHGRYQGPGGGASPTGSAVTNVSYPDDDPYVGPFNDPLKYQDYGPFSRTRPNSVVHQTWRVDTNAEEVMRRFIHRFTEEEKRRLNITSYFKNHIDALVAQSLDAVSKRIATSMIRDLAMYDMSQSSFWSQNQEQCNLPSMLPADP
ncbi:hypothetical protein BU17DRAFT_72091 [Hysterangium stoloniferum]|nr:hypothetical protein BU17DRAFT_72091 [Hysterangium stoloniferum]